MNRRQLLSALVAGVAGFILAPGYFLRPFRGLAVGPVVHDGSAWAPANPLTIRIGQSIGHFSGTDVLHRDVVARVTMCVVEPGVRWNDAFDGIGGCMVTAYTPRHMYMFLYRSGEVVDYGCQCFARPGKCVSA